MEGLTGLGVRGGLFFPSRVESGPSRKGIATLCEEVSKRVSVRGVVESFGDETNLSIGAVGLQ
jgi:hypothetical protein